MTKNNIIYISGSPRKRSNTDILLKIALEITGGESIKLSDFNVKTCDACWARQLKKYIIDDMTKDIISLLLHSKGIIIGSPVFFKNISNQIKAFIERTWCIKSIVVKMRAPPKQVYSSSRNLQRTRAINKSVHV